MKTLFSLFTLLLLSYFTGYTKDELPNKISDFTYITVEDEITITGYTGQDKKVIIPSSINDLRVTTIGQEAFTSQPDIKQITIPFSIRRIEQQAFYHCIKLTEVVMEEGVEVIGKGAFEECTFLKKITFPSTLKRIEDYAFSGCSSLSSVRLSNSVEFLGKAVFIDCTQLSSVTLSENLVALEESAFSSCVNLRKIILPKQLVRIEDEVFAGCFSLRSIIISPTVEHIGARAFARCEWLTKVILPEKINFIGYEAFDKCTYLGLVEVKSPEPPVLGHLYNGNNLYNQWSDTSEKLKIIVPASSIESYKKSEGWNKYAEKIKGK